MVIGQVYFQFFIFGDDFPYTKTNFPTVKRNISGNWAKLKCFSA